MEASIEKENEYRETPVKISGMVPNLVKRNNKHRDTLAGLHNNDEVSAMLWDTELHDRVAFVLDNMPLSETNFRYHDPKAEEEMSALIKQFRREIYGADIEIDLPGEDLEEEPIQEVAG